MPPESLQFQLDSSLSNVELRQVIEVLSRKLDYLYRTMGVPFPDDELPGYVMQARELILLDRDAEAVKVIREHTAVGIIEARSIVEDMRRRLRRAPLATASAHPSNSQSSVAFPVSSESFSPASFSPESSSPEPSYLEAATFGSGIDWRTERSTSNSEAPRLSANEIWQDDSTNARATVGSVSATAWR